MASVVGIDLGTTNTVVAVVRGGKAMVLADENGNRLLPSVVSFHPNGEVLVGVKARERRLVDARNTVYSIKRLIGRSWQSDEVEKARGRFPFELREGPTHGPLVVARNETYTLPEISAFVLRRAKEIAEKALGEPVERAVVTVPASFNDLQRASTKVAAREAGLEVLRILNEPTAAALAYGFGKSGSERIAVYDFGGGTFDLTLLDLSGNVFEVIATAGDSFLGGDDVDQVIADRIAMSVIQQTRYDPRQDVQVMERLRAAAEQVKIALSSQLDMHVELKEVGYGPGGSPIDVKFQMSRNELEQLSTPLIDRTFKVCGEALQLARVQTDAFDNIILVGGSTRIPAVRRKVESYFGKKPMDRVNPDEVVAIGAAIQAAALTGAERRRQSTPAPMNTNPDPNAVKATRIQTLGGVGKDGRKGPLAPPPRTTGRIVTSPIGADTPRPAIPSRTDAARVEAAAQRALADGLDEETTVNRQVEALLEDEETTINRPATQPPVVPRAPATPSDLGGYPDIPGAVPARQQTTAPLVPQSTPVNLKNTGRQIAAPHEPAVHVGPPAFDMSPEPGPLPRGFPDHSPEPVHLRNLAPQRAQEPSGPFPAQGPSFDFTPPPQPAPKAPAQAPKPLASTQISTQIAVPLPPPTPEVRTHKPALHSAPSFPNLGTNPGFDAPLLIDVTPLTLAVETVGGFVDKVIARNTPVPCSQTRTFTTSVDGQQVVLLRVCQGEGDAFMENTSLGQLELSGLRAARRGEVMIEVTFELDADGILQVKARDLETSRETGAQMRLIGLDGGRSAVAAV